MTSRTVKSLHTHRVAHQARAYPKFGGMKPPGVFLLLPGWEASCEFATTHLYTWLERGTVIVKWLAQEDSTMSPAWA